MIKSYSQWERINEVDELTEPVLTGKYFDGIVQAYESSPGMRPSRDVKNFPNAKSTQPLSTFIKSRSGKTSAEIISDVINDWYDWPSDSQAKKILLGYINNSDDLSNLSAFGTPFGKVIQADPSIAYIGPKTAFKAIKSVAKGTRKLFGWVPKLLGMKESRIQSNTNEGAIVGIIGTIVVGTLLSAATKYTLYGKESLQDDPLVSWITPYLPDINPVFKEDPIIASYVHVYNVMMMIVYDAWNLCMGQEKYGNEPNAILSWKNQNNYITEYYNQYYEPDADIKSSFVTFMGSLKNACMKDMESPNKFQGAPFYYTGDKVRVHFEDGRTENIELSGWYPWLKSNYKTYMFVPVSSVEFNAEKRKGPFAPLSSLGLEEVAKGDPTRQITVTFPDGSVSNFSLLELEIYLLNSNNTGSYEIETENVIGGGSTLVLKNREGVQEEVSPDVPTKNPSIIEGSTLKEIATNLKSEDLSSFIGMGDV